MILCNDTIELFILLTTDSPQIFYDALGERIAAMLNYNMLQLLGPRSAELKVKDAKQRFEWDPRQFLQQIVTVYINLSSEKFAESIAMDEVCPLLGWYLEEKALPDLVNDWLFDF